MRRLIGLVALAMAACSPMAADAGQSATTTAAKHPQSGLEVIPLTVESKGKRHAFRVEVARSDAEWNKGLMFRAAMGANEGMIFVGRPPQPASFWMKNTVIPLDLVFVGTDKRILNIGANSQMHIYLKRGPFTWEAVVPHLFMGFDITKADSG